MNMSNIDKIKEHTNNIYNESTALHSFSRLEFDRIMNIDITNSNDPVLSNKITLFLNAMELVRECASEIREQCNDITARLALCTKNPIDDDNIEVKAKEIAANG